MQKLDPKAVWLFFLGSIASFVLSLAIFMIFIINFIIFVAQMFEINLLLGLAFAPIFIVFKYLWARLTYNNYKYELRDDGFRKEHGVIWEKYVTIPYERIQNVDILRGPIARILGLSDLNIQTAGMSSTVGSYGGGAEGRLPGITPQVAEQLRDQLIARARGKNQGL